VLDDGTIADRRGSLNVDDEGNASQRNVLIENGKLVGYMQDRQNARLMGMKATGNGRRQGYAHTPMPRMTNTYMLGGDKTPEEIIASVKKGVYAVSFGGGQVDITSGKFVFGCTEAYLIENGNVVAHHLLYFGVAKTLSLPKQPGLTAEWRDGGKTLRIGSNQLARGVWIDFGKLDANLSDNAFDLLPGEHVDIVVDSKADAASLKAALKLTSLVDAVQPETAK